MNFGTLVLLFVALVWGTIFSILRAASTYSQSSRRAE